MSAGSAIDLKRSPVPLSIIDTLREVGDTLPVALYACEAPSGRIVFFNSKAFRLWGREPALGENDERFCGSFRLWRPDGSFLPHEATPMARAIAEGRAACNEEVIVERPDGGRIAIVVNIHPILEDGRVVGAVNAFHETDVLKHTSEALAQLAAIIESSSDAILSKSLEGVILSWNAAATRMFGYRVDEVVGQSVMMLIPPDLHEEERRILEQISRGERLEHYDTVRVAKDGRRIPVSLTASPIRSAEGGIIGVSTIARDFSDREQAERAVRRSESQLYEEAQALARLNAASTRLWRSHSLEEGLNEILLTVIDLVGADKGNVQLVEGDGETLAIVVQHGFDQHFLEVFRRVTASDGSACARALRTSRPAIIEDVEGDAEYAPFRDIARKAGYRAVATIPLIGLERKLVGMISTHFRRPHRPSEQELRRLDLYCRQAADFIERIRIEQTLRENEEALREADRRKDEFLALLAHELRNPLAPIRYAVAAGKLGGRTEEQQRRAEEIIDRQVAHMGRLLDDLLDISRITRGKLELKKSSTELTAVVGAAIEAARPLLDAKHHTLALDLPTEPVRLVADSVRLAQVFSNLLINAAKYSDDGGYIRLTAALHDGEIVVSVQDNGMGIAPDMMPRLFTLFSQARSALDRSEEGLGVGLALARGLVMLHGGHIEAKSDGPGRGSEFTVRLPRGEMARAPERIRTMPAAASPREALRILVVDDNRDAADSCATLLELEGHEVRTEYLGRRAIELAESFRPHALLLDIGLPDLSGYEVAARIRQATWGQDIALVAVTGWGQTEDRRRAFDAGFDHHLTKPVDPDALDSLLSSLRGAVTAS